MAHERETGYPTHAESVARKIGVTLTREQVKAARYLEKFGMRFCAHFGYANVIDKAREHFRKLRIKSRRVH